MEALESMRPGTRQRAPKGPDLALDRGRASDRSFDTGPEAPEPRGETREERTRGTRKSPEGGRAETTPSHSPRKGRYTRKEWSRNRCPPPPPGVTQDEPQGNQGVRGILRPGAYASGPRPDHPHPQGQGRPDQERRSPQPAARATRARSMSSPKKADDERSGVATPGAPASAGTSKVRRAGGLRGPHATASEPVSEGRARRKLQAWTEDDGGAARSITTRTEDRETGSSE